jgi:hypothetical protein
MEHIRNAAVKPGDSARVVAPRRVEFRRIRAPRAFEEIADQIRK